MKSLEQRVADLEFRNQRVEKDKAWETSLTRRLIISSLTYVVVATYLSFTGVKDPLTAAVVPALGYFLSTLVIKSVKNYWTNK